MSEPRYKDLEDGGKSFFADMNKTLLIEGDIHPDTGNVRRLSIGIVSGDQTTQNRLVDASFLYGYFLMSSMTLFAEDKGELEKAMNVYANLLHESIRGETVNEPGDMKRVRVTHDFIFNKKKIRCITTIRPKS